MTYGRGGYGILSSSLADIAREPQRLPRPHPQVAGRLGTGVGALTTASNEQVMPVNRATLESSGKMLSRRTLR